MVAVWIVQEPAVRRIVVDTLSAGREMRADMDPTRQPLQPEATGAVMEVTKWLKPLVRVSRLSRSQQVARGIDAKKNVVAQGYDVDAG